MPKISAEEVLVRNCEAALDLYDKAAQDGLVWDEQLALTTEEMREQIKHYREAHPSKPTIPNRAERS